MCGIFAYLNFLTPKSRKEVVDILIQGLRRMEYRKLVYIKVRINKYNVYYFIGGYDSAGLAIDGSNDALCPHDEVTLFRRCGKVDNLQAQING